MEHSGVELATLSLIWKIAAAAVALALHGPIATRVARDHKKQNETAKETAQRS